MIMLALIAAMATDPTAAWSACLHEKTTAYAKVSEPAETIAQAVLGACSDKELGVRDHMEDMVRHNLLASTTPRDSIYTKSDEITSRDFAELRKTAHDKVLSWVVEVRASGPQH
jgi:hypothetical protein